MQVENALSSSVLKFREPVKAGAAGIVPEVRAPWSFSAFRIAASKHVTAKDGCAMGWGTCWCGWRSQTLWLRAQGISLPSPKAVQQAAVQAGKEAKQAVESAISSVTPAAAPKAAKDIGVKLRNPLAPITAAAAGGGGPLRLMHHVQRLVLRHASLGTGLKQSYRSITWYLACSCCGWHLWRWRRSLCAFSSPLSGRYPSGWRLPRQC